jgi:hypothetical protein
MSRYQVYKYQTEKIGRSLIKKGDSAKQIKAIANSIAKDCGAPFQKVMDSIKEKDFLQLGMFAAFGMQHRAQEDPDGIDALARVAVTEMHHFDSGRKVLFVPDESLLIALYESCLTVDFASLKSNSDEVYAFAPHIGLVLDELEIKPFIFSTDMALDGSIMLNVTCNGDKDNPIADIFEDEYKELVGKRFPLTKHHKGETFTSLSVYLKLATSLFVYMRAFPECVKPGIPSDMSITEMVHGGPKNKRTGFTITAPIDRATGTTLHLRRGHFRSLHDQRFKRNEDGSIKIVWVRDTVVGGKIDPYTVEDVSA